jgi:predicted transglutaminase-like cysteine proteinase
VVFLLIKLIKGESNKGKYFDYFKILLKKVPYKIIDLFFDISFEFFEEIEEIEEIEKINEKINEKMKEFKDNNNNEYEID